jgi:hypothetical protein
MLELLFRSRFRWRLRPHSVTGDAAYGTTENITAVEKAGMRAYMVLPNHDERGPLFGKNEFTYDAEKDLYTSAPEARPCAAAKATTTRRDPSGTLPSPPPATRAPSRAAARRARRDAG